MNQVVSNAHLFKTCTNQEEKQLDEISLQQLYAVVTKDHEAQCQSIVLTNTTWIYKCTNILHRVDKNYTIEMDYIRLY